jgi:hypothetical protein
MPRAATQSSQIDGPKLTPEGPIKMLHVKSSIKGDHYGEKFFFIDPISKKINYDPELLLKDKHVENNYSRRKFINYDCSFREISARRIAGCFISNEYIAHDHNFVYVDSSILCASALDCGETSSQRLAATAARAPTEFPIDQTHADEEVMVFHNEGGGTWGHFLAQNIPRALLLRERFPHVKIAIPRGQRPGLKNNFSKALEFFGFDEDNIVTISADITYQFRAVWIVDFLYSWKSGGHIHPIAINILHKHAGKIDIISELDFENAGFYAERSKNSRAIINNEEVNNKFRDFSINPLMLGKLPPGEQFAAWGRTRLACGVLGSDLTNMIFAQERTSILVISPHKFGDHFFYNLAAAKNLRWLEIRCGHIADPTDPKHSQFWVDTDLLNSVLGNIAE